MFKILSFQQVININVVERYTWNLQKQVWVLHILSTFQVGVAAFQVLEFTCSIWLLCDPGQVQALPSSLGSAAQWLWERQMVPPLGQNSSSRPMWSHFVRSSLSDTNHRPAHLCTNPLSSYQRMLTVCGWMGFPSLLPAKPILLHWNGLSSNCCWVKGTGEAGAASWLCPGLCLMSSFFNLLFFLILFIWVCWVLVAAHGIFVALGRNFCCGAWTL